MADSNSSYRCSHGMCLGHDPDWENIGKTQYRPNPGIFGRKLYGYYCCGKRMIRSEAVQEQKCKKCGRTRMNILYSQVALCSCCGHHRVYSIIEVFLGEGVSIPGD